MSVAYNIPKRFRKPRTWKMHKKPNLSEGVRIVSTRYGEWLFKIGKSHYPLHTINVYYE